MSSYLIWLFAILLIAICELNNEIRARENEPFFIYSRDIDICHKTYSIINPDTPQGTMSDIISRTHQKLKNNKNDHLHIDHLLY